MNQQLNHIEFLQEVKSGKLQVKDDSRKLKPAQLNQIYRWLNDLTARPGTQPFIDIIESIVDPDASLWSPTRYRAVRYNAHRMSVKLRFRDGRPETLHFMMAATPDWTVQIVGGRVDPRNRKLIPWNMTLGKEMSPEKPLVELAA